MVKSIRTQLSLTILLLVLITIGLIGIFSNVLINRMFTAYATEQGEIRSESLVSDLGLYYDTFSRRWNVNYLHITGMQAMYEGYVLKIKDLDGQVIWDAENHDCWHVMDVIIARMERRGVRGRLITNTYEIQNNRRTVGSVAITYYGPYFLSEADFAFMHTLNTVLLTIGLLAGLFSVVLGILLAKRIARPISKTAQIARQISEGNYGIRFEGHTKMRELNELSVAINDLAKALNEQENLRRRLTSDMAHELRTPLTAIGSHLEAMIMGIWEATPERLQGCHDEVKRLASLVADLGQLAKIEEDQLKLNRQKADLLNIAQTVADSMRAELDKKEMMLSVLGHASFAYVDPDRMHQVIANLLSNAIKYAPNGTAIEIEILDTEKSSVIKVKDRGIGIPEDALTLIFERFYRTENSRNRKSGGAGIGLSIVKSIVLAHGGSVVAESQLGIGSCFTVQIPKSSK